MLRRRRKRVEVWTLPSLPAVPSLYLAFPVKDIQLNLFFTGVSGATLYYFERSLTGVGGWTDIGSTPAPTFFFESIGLTPNTLYYYRMRAWNAAGYSGYSSVVSGTTYDADAYAFMVEGPIDNDSLRVGFNSLVLGLKAANFYTKLDRLFLFKADNDTAAKKCCITYEAGEYVGNLLWEPYIGLNQKDDTGYFNTNFASIDTTVGGTANFYSVGSVFKEGEMSGSDNGGYLFGATNSTTASSYYGAAWTDGTSDLALSSIMFQATSSLVDFGNTVPMDHHYAVWRDTVKDIHMSVDATTIASSSVSQIAPVMCEYDYYVANLNKAGVPTTWSKFDAFTTQPYLITFWCGVIPYTGRATMTSLLQDWNAIYP